MDRPGRPRADRRLRLIHLVYGFYPLAPAGLAPPQIELPAGACAAIVWADRVEEEQMTVAAGMATPVVVQGSRTPAVWGAIAAALVIALLLPMGAPWGGGVRSLSVTTSVLGLGFFGALEMLSLIAIMAPDRLEISPSGVLIRHLWFVRRFAWDQLNAFRLVGGTGPYATDRIIGIAPEGAPPGRLFPRLTAPKWVLPTTEVLVLLEDARARWGRPAAVGADGRASLSTRAALGDRVSRRRYWITIAVMLGSYAALSLLAGVGRLDGVPFAVVFMLSRGRLHDIGLSGWWSLGAMPAAVVLELTRENLPLLGYSLLHGLSPPVGALLCGLALTVGLLVWLGIEPGEPPDNRYGLSPARRPRLIL